VVFNTGTNRKELVPGLCNHTVATTVTSKPCLLKDRGEGVDCDDSEGGFVVDGM